MYFSRCSTSYNCNRSCTALIKNDSFHSRLKLCVWKSPDVHGATTFGTDTYEAKNKTFLLTLRIMSVPIEDLSFCSSGLLLLTVLDTLLLGNGFLNLSNLRRKHV